MPSDKTTGVIILILSILGIAIYGYAIYAYTVVTLQITVLLAVGSILTIVAWIGYTMATAPPSEPIATEYIEAPTVTETTKVQNTTEKNNKKTFSR